jgi:hypothetical protein
LSRAAVVVLGEGVLLAALLALFWYQDWRYSLPTPRPALFDPPVIGSTLVLPETLRALLPPAEKRPVLLHFINPACPCSRFNLEHVRKLQQQFAHQVDIVAVTEGSNPDTLLAQFTRLDWNVSVVCDTNRSLAKLAGVYATPQAVILDPDGRLFYRGNYNTSRYCVAEQTQFVRIALESLLRESTNPLLQSAQATQAYGCALPVCVREGAGL